MSTREREPEQSVPLKYAPERALAPAPEPSPGSDRPGSELRLGGAHAPERRPPLVPRTPEPAPPWKMAKPKGSLEGDVASGEFRDCMALAPDLPPPLPMRDDGGWVFAGYQPAADEQPDQEPAPYRARVHAASPTFGGFRPAVLRSSPMRAAAVDADTPRPCNVPTPLNRPLLFATAPSPRRDRCGGQSDPGAQLVSKGRGPWFEGCAAATQPVRPIGAPTHVGMVCAGPGGAG